MRRQARALDGIHRDVKECSRDVKGNLGLSRDILATAQRTEDLLGKILASQTGLGSFVRSHLGSFPNLCAGSRPQAHQSLPLISNVAALVRCVGIAAC